MDVIKIMPWILKCLLPIVSVITSLKPKTCTADFIRPNYPLYHIMDILVSKSYLFNCKCRYYRRKSPWNIIA